MKKRLCWLLRECACGRAASGEELSSSLPRQLPLCAAGKEHRHPQLCVSHRVGGASPGLADALAFRTPRCPSNLIARALGWRGRGKAWPGLTCIGAHGTYTDMCVCVYTRVDIAVVCVICLRSRQ